MSISFPDELAGTFQKPLIPLNEAVGAVRSFTLAGSALTLTLVSATDKTGNRAIEITLPSAGSGDGTGLYAVARYRRTTAAGVPSVPTGNSDSDWSADYTATDRTNPYSWLALKIGTGTDPDDATGWQILPVDSPEASGVSGVSSIGAGTGISVDQATGAVTVSVDSVLEGIRTAFSGVGVKDADAGDGGVVAVQSGALNISIANTYNFDGEGNIRPYNLAIQTANPRIMVGIKNNLVPTRSDYFVRYNGSQLTPDLNQGNWTVVPGNRAGTAAQYTWYEIQLAGVTANVGAVALENIGQINHLLIPREIVDDEVEDFALRRRTARAPASRLPEASETAAGIISAAFYQRIEKAVQDDAVTNNNLTASQLQDDDAALVRDASVTQGNEIAAVRMAELDKRWYTQTDARNEVLHDYFDSAGWEAFAQGEIAITRVGNPPVEQLFTTPGFVETPGVPLGYDYTSAVVDVSPRPDDNRVLYIRVPLSVVDSGSVRLNLDLDGEAGSNPQSVQLDADQITPPRRFREVDRNATHVVYGLQFTSIAQDAQLQMQQYDLAQIDRRYVDVDDIFPDTTGKNDGDILTLVDASENTRDWRPPRHTGGALRALRDNAAIAVAVTNSSASRMESATLSMDPAFSVSTNSNGVFIIDERRLLSGRSVNTIAYNVAAVEADAELERDDDREIFASRVLAAAAFNSGNTVSEGILLSERQIHNGSGILGTSRSYAARTATGEFIVYKVYEGNAGALSFTEQSFFTISFLPTDSGAGGGASVATETLLDYQTSTIGGSHSFVEFTNAPAFRELTAADDNKMVIIDACLFNGGVPNPAPTNRDNWSIPITMTGADLRTARATTAGDDLSDVGGSTWIIAGQTYGNNSVGWNRGLLGISAGRKPMLAYNNAGGFLRLRIRLIG